MRGARPVSSVSRTADDPTRELVRIRTLNTEELRSLWLKMTGARPTRQLSGELLRRMVMHRAQEQSLGGLDRPTARMLDRLVEGGGVVPTCLKVGTVLVREHQGLMHQVMVVEGGFAWNGQVLPSLSAAAKAITGTTWNGNRFFGLRKPASDREAPGRGRSQDALARSPAPRPNSEASA